MKKFVAFLRGINVSGKNKISMRDLKKMFETIGFENVVTVLNSGNIIFCSAVDSTVEMTEKIKKEIKNTFGFEIPVLVMDCEKLKDILKQSPSWWGLEDKSVYDNLIFVIPPATSEDVLKELGEPNLDLEKNFVYENQIFWSFDRLKYTKSFWWKKSASERVGNKITIRTAGTIKKIIESSKDCIF